MLKKDWDYRRKVGKKINDARSRLADLGNEVNLKISELSKKMFIIESMISGFKKSVENIERNISEHLKEQKKVLRDYREALPNFAAIRITLSIISRYDEATFITL